LSDRKTDSRKTRPRIAERFAAKIGAETAEKWAGRLIPAGPARPSAAAAELFVCEGLGPPCLQLIFVESISKPKLRAASGVMLQFEAAFN